MNYSTETLLFLGGIFHVGFAVFHLTFWKIFNWKDDLASLTHINRSIMQILNLRLTSVFLIIAYISLFYRPELISTSLGKTLLISISLFWFFRTIEQIAFFGVNNGISFTLTLIFFAGGVLYLSPVLLG